MPLYRIHIEVSVRTTSLEEAEKKLWPFSILISRELDEKIKSGDRSSYGASSGSIELIPK